MGKMSGDLGKTRKILTTTSFEMGKTRKIPTTLSFEMGKVRLGFLIVRYQIGLFLVAK